MMSYYIGVACLLLGVVEQFVVSNAQTQKDQIGAPPVPAIFAFGDSIVDVGNNNFINSIAKANYWPYGCDFGRGPTGRFSNGKTVTDLLGEKVGVPNLVSFADPTTFGSRAILSGVNYASAGSGILDDTGKHWGDRYSLSQQVMNFERTLDQLRILMDEQKLRQYLARSVVIMSVGSNDYINNYLLPSIYSSSFNYSPPDFGNLLINHYTRQILALYNVGLRKFLLAGIAPLGCIPNQRASGQAPQGRCVDSVNQMLGTFNEGLHSLVQQLNANHPAAIFVYANTYRIIGDILNNPAAYGFTVIDRACCPLGPVSCLPSAVPCPNRNEYAFWDGYHTTEAANAIIAQRIFDGPQSDCFPINFQQLALI